MKRPTDSIRKAIEEFFRAKDPSIQVDVKTHDSTFLSVAVIFGDKDGVLEIENRFFDQDGSWDSLTDRLDEYWDDVFPNEKHVRIAPWPRDAK